MSSSGETLEKYQIPLDEILRVTGNFSSETLIGDGGFGMVHIGELSKDGQTRIVAIKRLNQGGYQGNNEFRNELEMVSSFHHPNIINFIGYCDEANEKIIVYDYAKNGSLDRYLEKPDKMRNIPWTQRLKICLGAAKGLKYLHSGLEEHIRVIHRDVKSANILLDDNLEAKICDFGLSRFGARNEEQTQLLTKAAGTRFYMDPLYAERISRLRKESDVYSFGVVMFEMSSGTLVYREKCFRDDAKKQYLIDVVRSYYDDQEKGVGPYNLIDPVLIDHTNMESFNTFNKIAHECLSLSVTERPTMARIIRKIEQALNIQLKHLESPSATRSLRSFLVPFKAINLATQNFHMSTCIGKDEYGEVYTGQLYKRLQNRTMAIKSLHPKSYQREHEFYNELNIICSFHHQNISTFIGYCDQDNKRIVVHEHAVNGSVADHLQDQKKRGSLTWAQRLKICVGAARGLKCLHLALGEDNPATIGFINSGNILLDENMEAKIAFFGLSKIDPPGSRPDEHISRLHKSNMYSFGVIMCEMLSGLMAYELTRSREVRSEDQISLLQDYYYNNELDQFIDHSIRDQIDRRCLNVFKETAYHCIMRDNQRTRPGIGPSDSRGAPAGLTMDKVVERIEDAADLQGVDV